MFTMYLPATTDSASTVEEKTSTIHRGSGSFLIMDDEEVVRETIAHMLTILGYTVVQKENGKDAVDYFKTELREKRPLAGMILDLTVPGGPGGKDAIEEIRKLDREIPVFVASGYADDPVIQNPSEYGFTASICKPFVSSELGEMLNEYMNRRKAVDKGQ